MYENKKLMEMRSSRGSNPESRVSNSLMYRACFGKLARTRRFSGSASESSLYLISIRGGESL